MFSWLFCSTQAAVVLLNNRGWVGYLRPHAIETKLYCHFHRQERLDGEFKCRLMAFEHVEMGVVIWQSFSSESVT